MQPVLVASKRYLNEADNRTKTSKHKSFFDFGFSVDKSCYMTTTTSRLCSCTVVLIYLSLTSIKFLLFICLFSHTQESSFGVCTAQHSKQRTTYCNTLYWHRHFWYQHHVRDRESMNGLGRTSTISTMA